MKINGVDYMESRDCLSAIRMRIDELSKGADPAPWFVASPAARPGDNATPNVRKMAIDARANQTFFRAMLLNRLAGWFVDANERWRIPGWAWADQGGNWRALLHGYDFLHPLAPPEVRRWAWHEVLVDRTEFERWLQSDELADQAGFPGLPLAHDEGDRPAYVVRQEPPDRPTVSLAEAASWLAFGVSLDARTLMSGLSGGFLAADEGDAVRRLEAATERLVTAGTGGLPFFGKFIPAAGDPDSALTERIEPARFEDFRQLDLAFDGLRYGVGVHYDWTDPGLNALARSYPSAAQRYVDVKVERTGLMSLSPISAPATDAQESAGSLNGIFEDRQFSRDDPSQITPWWSINQALAWIATRTPSYVEYVGSLEGTEPSEYRPFIVMAGWQASATTSREGRQFLDACAEDWPEGSIGALAGRQLLAKILSEEIRPLASGRGQSRLMRREEFVGVGTRDNGSDWLDLNAQPVFSSAEIMAGFPQSDRNADDLLHRGPRATPAEDPGDGGWIEGLPRGWIDAKVAAIRCCRLIKKRFEPCELAPWMGTPSVRESVRLFGISEAEAAENAKLDEHITAIFRRAFLSGVLSASMFSDGAFKALPKAAFLHSSVLRSALMHGVMDIDPFWPDEWWPWTGSVWAIPKDQFEAWLASGEPNRMDDLPTVIRLTKAETMPLITGREPTMRARVPLSEAVSWVAFGTALEARRLEMALHWDRLADGDLQEVQQAVSQAVAGIVAAGADGKIAFSGRHMEDRQAKGATNAAIDALKLDDYRAFVIGRDDLLYGEGLHRTYRAKNDTQLKNSERRDYFSQVTVSRDELLSLVAAEPEPASGAPQKLADHERRLWMLSQPMMAADAAHKLYKQHPQFCGTKLPEFRKEWGEVKGTKRGRPRKAKIDE